MTEKNKLQFSYPQDRKKLGNCKLGHLKLVRLNSVYLIFLQFIIEKSVTSVSFTVETWYLDMGMTSAKTCTHQILRSYRKSNVKYDDVIYDFFCKIFLNFTLSKIPWWIFIISIHIDYRVMTIIVLNFFAFLCGANFCQSLSFNKNYFPSIYITIY